MPFEPIKFCIECERVASVHSRDEHMKRIYYFCEYCDKHCDEKCHERKMRVMADAWGEKE